MSGTYPASVGQQAVSYLAWTSFLANAQTLMKKAAVPLKDCEHTCEEPAKVTKSL